MTDELRLFGRAGIRYQAPENGDGGEGSGAGDGNGDNSNANDSANATPTPTVDPKVAELERQVQMLQANQNDQFDLDDFYGDGRFDDFFDNTPQSDLQEFQRQRNEAYARAGIPADQRQALFDADMSQKIDGYYDKVGRTQQDHAKQIDEMGIGRNTYQAALTKLAREFSVDDWAALEKKGYNDLKDVPPKDIIEWVKKAEEDGIDTGVSAILPQQAHNPDDEMIFEATLPNAKGDMVREQIRLSLKDEHAEEAYKFLSTPVGRNAIGKHQVWSDTDEGKEIAKKFDELRAKRRGH